MLTRSQTVDVGHGRGRLAPAAAASLWRVDARLGRPADCNSLWRDPVTQARLYAAWMDYWRDPAAWRRRNPGKSPPPRALSPQASVHCDGEAADSDDWYNASAAAVWRLGGWRQTARTSRPDTDEPWHGEYFPELDRLAGSGSGDGSVPLPIPTPDPNPDPIELEDDDMVKNVGLSWTTAKGEKRVAITNPGSGYWTEYQDAGGAFNDKIAAAFDCGPFVAVTESHIANLRASAEQVRGG